MNEPVHQFGNNDFTLSAGVYTDKPVSINSTAATPVFKVNDAGWTTLEVKHFPEEVLYVHGLGEIIRGEEFNVTEVYDSKTMRLRQRIVTRADLMTGAGSARLNNSDLNAVLQAAIKHAAPIKPTRWQRWCAFWEGLCK